ncbi:MFS general substrate transporter [Mycena metata]|uniref:MFS general substrate transporter n=1 Tax=Mycena metata TaxID=1033252 RepID=A0AAD7K4H3_9AGAR|nr:MFS general substrate transporter [Mycena metata]
MSLSTNSIDAAVTASDRESVKTLGVPSLPATNTAEFIMMKNLNPSPAVGVGSASRNNDSASHNSSAGNHVLRARLQLGAIYWSMFLAGWNDGTSGPLIPRMQRVYDVSFLIVSLVFVISSVGFISGAALNMHWTDKVGFGRLLVLGAACQVAAYSIQAPAPPFPVFAASFFLNGLALSIQNAQANAYVASLRVNSEMYMGMLHASYGAGALCSPLVATRFAQLDHWSFHYLASLGIAVINIIILTLTFRFRMLDESLALIGQAPGDTSTSDRSNFRQILSLKSVHILGFFALMYVGVEVTIGGWITTYLIDVRGAGPSAGYTTSGFFAGIMVGRLALLWLNKKIGERRVLYLYVALAMGLEFIVWFVPSFIGGAVAVSLVGLFLGPMYPLIMNAVGRTVPSGSIGWIAGLGQTGSAILPFVTGAIASKTGIRTLQPLLISLMAMFPVLWALVPNSPQRID